MLDPILLQIAKSAILERFGSTAINKTALYEKYPLLKEERAVFVTLHKHKDLRGCIGSIIVHRTLLEDVIHNAQSAAFSDPRFGALRSDELEALHLEVSVLTPPKALIYSDINDLIQKIRLKIDGLILKHGYHQGAFLPQVWEQLQSPENFLEHLAYKAGLSPDVYAHHPEIYAYQVDAIEEDFNTVRPL